MSTVTAYNFRRPDRVSKEQLWSLHFVHERFALNLSTSLSAFLRAVTEVTIVGVDQRSYAEFLFVTPDPTAFYAISMAPIDGFAALEINPSVAFPIVDRMLGGSGNTTLPERSLTEIEQNVLDGAVALILQQLTDTWKAIADVQFKVHGRETRPQMLQVTGSSEIVIVLAFDVRVGEALGRVNVCIPAAAIDSRHGRFVQGWHHTTKPPAPEEERNLVTNLGRVPLPLTVRLETRLNARDVMLLRPGDVIALGHPATAAVDVHIGRIPRFAGRLMRGAGGAAVVIDDAPDAAPAAGDPR
ncbi:MAG: flagellar motor switch protein FliM [Vicinamibacterales bacterium]